MNDELPDLDEPSDIDRLHLHNRSMATTILVGGAALFPWVWLIMSLISGNRIGLAIANFVGMYVGLYVMFKGWQRDDRAQMYRGGTTAAAGFVLAVSTGSYLSS